MNIKKAAMLCIVGFLALTSFMARPLLADEWNKKIEFDFSAPVQIPGQTLPAGKYVFQLANEQSDRDIVQIFSEDSSGAETLVKTLLAIPAYRLDTPDNPVINFAEQPSGSPEAIQSWFYSGEHTGSEFTYPPGHTGETN